MAACVAVAAGACGGPTPGPFDLGVEETETYGRFPVGTVVSFGGASFRHTGDEAAVIDSIELRPAAADSGARVTAVYLADLTGVPETSALVVGFPPANQASVAFVPAAGATVQPGTTYQVLFVVSVDRPGDWVFPIYEIRYRVGDEDHVGRSATGLRVCAPQEVACGQLPASPTGEPKPSSTG